MPWGGASRWRRESGGASCWSGVDAQNGESREELAGWLYHGLRAFPPEASLQRALRAGVPDLDEVLLGHEPRTDPTSAASMQGGSPGRAVQGRSNSDCILRNFRWRLEFSLAFLAGLREKGR